MPRKSRGRRPTPIWLQWLYIIFLICLVIFIIGTWYALRGGEQRHTESSHPQAKQQPAPKPLANYTQAELLQLDQKYTADDIEEMFAGSIKPMLEQAGRSDPISAIRRSVNQLVLLSKVGTFKVVMSGQFYRHGGRMTPWVLADSKPAFYDQSDKLLQPGYVTLYLPAFEEYLMFPDRFNDALISTLCHEYYHLKFDTPRVDDEGFIEGEAMVWGKQVEDVLLPMQKAGRFLRPVQWEAIEAYEHLKDQPDKWRAWIASRHRKRLSH